jgi:hypothetical protein
MPRPAKSSANTPAGKRPWWRRLAWGKTPLAVLVKQAATRVSKAVSLRRFYWGGVPLARVVRQRMQRTQNLVWRQRLSLALVAVSTLALLLPASAIASVKAWFAVYVWWQPTYSMAFTHGDKVGHAALFAVLAFACRLSWPYTPMAMPAGALVLLGVVTEVLQFWVPGRTGTWGDMAADCTGVVLGLTLGWLRWPGAKNALSPNIRVDS